MGVLHVARRGAAGPLSSRPLPPTTATTASRFPLPHPPLARSHPARPPPRVAAQLTPGRAIEKNAADAYRRAGGDDSLVHARKVPDDWKILHSPMHVMDANPTAIDVKLLWLMAASHAMLVDCSQVNIVPFLDTQRNAVAYVLCTPRGLKILAEYSANVRRPTPRTSLLSPLPDAPSPTFAAPLRARRPRPRGCTSTA